MATRDELLKRQSELLTERALIKERVREISRQLNALRAALLRTPDPYAGVPAWVVDLIDRELTHLDEAGYSVQEMKEHEGDILRRWREGELDSMAPGAPARPTTEPEPAVEPPQASLFVSGEREQPPLEDRL